MAMILAVACALTVQAGETQPAALPEGTPTFEEMPIIDIHAHLFRDVAGLPEFLRAHNVRCINICTGGTDLDKLKQMEQSGEHLFNKYGALFPFASTFDLTERDAPDYVEQVTQWLDETFEAGAVMAKIWKEVGLDIKDAEGNFILPDDPLFDPIYEHLANRGKPLMAHIAEPKESWEPLDPETPFHAYYVQNPQWHIYGKPEYPSYQQLIAARDRILDKHPGLILIGAHLGSMSHDVDEVAKRLDKCPNFYCDTAARTVSLTRQPAEKARKFFEKYQDRIMFGVDLGTPDDGSISEEASQEFVKTVERAYLDEYQYYAGTGTMEFWGKEIECLGLPKAILEKFFYKNALRVIPGLAELVRASEETG